LLRNFHKRHLEIRKRIPQHGRFLVAKVAARLFLDHPELELSNNAVENSMRPVAIGRKNWIHVGSEQAGPRVAAIISIVETCRRLQIPAREYLAPYSWLGELPSKSGQGTNAGGVVRPEIANHQNQRRHPPRRPCG